MKFEKENNLLAIKSSQNKSFVTSLSISGMLTNISNRMGYSKLMNVPS